MKPIDLNAFIEHTGDYTEIENLDPGVYVFNDAGFTIVALKDVDGNITAMYTDGYPTNTGATSLMCQLD